MIMEKKLAVLGVGGVLVASIAQRLQAAGVSLVEADPINEDQLDVRVLDFRPGVDDFDDSPTLKGKRVAQWKQDAGFGRGRHRPR